MELYGIAVRKKKKERKKEEKNTVFPFVSTTELPAVARLLQPSQKILQNNNNNNSSNNNKRVPKRTPLKQF